jgi:hypothetical protein
VTIRRLGAAVALLLGLALSRATAQRATAQPFTAADLPGQLSLEARQTIARLGDSLRTARLPDEPLYAKAAEGVLKGADETRILGAVRALAHDLGEARAALGGGASDAELVAAASVLHVGATPAMLRRLQQARPVGRQGRPSLAIPLIALADLLTRQVPPTVAADAIESLVARRAPSDDFGALRAAVERDIDAGRSPEAAVTSRTQGLLHAIDARRSP